MVLVACVCAQCGVQFGMEQWAVKRGRGKYCSHECYSIAAAGRPKMMLRKRETRTCPVCGVVFETGGRAGRLDQVYCSNACAGKVRYRTGTTCLPLSPADAAYLAGFFDGEGSYILHGRGGLTGSITFRVAVVGSKPLVIEWIAEVTGLSSAQVREPAVAGWAPRWTWTVNGDAAVSFTKQIRPYIRLKTEQADLGLAFQERLRDPAYKVDRAWQEEWRQRMRLLNARGTDPRVPSE